MATEWETFPIKFEGGWITNLGRLDHGIQAPGSATILQNFEASIDGGYKRILGFSKFSETEVTGSGTIVGVIVADESKCLAYRGGTHYYSTGTTWTSMATASVTTSVKLRHDSYNWDGTERFVLVDGENDPAVYDPVANTVTYDTTAPANVAGANIVREFKNHIFFAKDNFLNFAAPYTTNDWNTGNGAGEINIGRDITGLIVFRDELIIFSTSTIHRLSGNTSTDFVLSPIAMDTGCLCADTVQEVGGDIMYLAPDGVRFLSATERNNDFGLERASAKIQDQITTLINTNCNYASLVVREKAQYRLFSYLTSVPRSYAEGYIATKYSDQEVTNIAWSKTVGMKVYAASSRQFRDSEIILFSSDDGYVYRMENGASFDGVDIEAIFETPFTPITDPRVRKTAYKHSLYAELSGGISLEVGLKLDYKAPNIIQPTTFLVSSDSGGSSVYGSPNAIYGSSVYAGAEQVTYVNQLVGSGFTFALRYEELSTNPPFTLDYAILEFGTNERR